MNGQSREGGTCQPLTCEPSQSSPRCLASGSKSNAPRSRGGRQPSKGQDVSELRNLRRGWAGGSASLSSPAVDSWSATAIAWTGPSSQVASSVSHHLPSLGRPLLHGLPGRPSSSWSPLFGGRQPLRCRSGLSVGRSTSGRPPPWCPQDGLLPAGTCWTLWQIGGDCNATAVRPRASSHHPLRRPGPVRASAHLSQVLVGAEVTPAVHSHGPAPVSASRSW